MSTCLQELLSLLSLVLYCIDGCFESYVSSRHISQWIKNVWIKSWCFCRKVIFSQRTLTRVCTIWISIACSVTWRVYTLMIIHCCWRGLLRKPKLSNPTYRTSFKWIISRSWRITNWSAGDNFHTIHSIILILWRMFLEERITIEREWLLWWLGVLLTWTANRLVDIFARLNLVVVIVRTHFISSVALVVLIFCVIVTNSVVVSIWRITIPWIIVHLLIGALLSWRNVGRCTVIWVRSYIIIHILFTSHIILARRIMVVSITIIVSVPVISNVWAIVVMIIIPIIIVGIKSVLIHSFTINFFFTIIVENINWGS